jgi:UDP-2-acetamido-2,6-beta-L-arabino-hexul-4-ose reductase
MIVGNGMIANAFESYQNNSRVLIFASGVPNSLEINIHNFNREELLLKKVISENKNHSIVYFSTCSIEDPSINQSQYVVHKLKMELIIKGMASNFFIFRLPQVVGNSKSPIFVNYLFNAIMSDGSIDIYKHSSRNLIGINDVFEICHFIINNNKFINQITNIATPHNLDVGYIVSEVESITKRMSKKNILNVGARYDINIDKILSLDKNFRIFSGTYTTNLLKDFFLRHYK